MALLLLFQGTSGETSEQPKDVSTSTNWPSAYTWHFSCSPIGLYLLGSGSLMLRNVAHHFWFCFSFCYIHFEQLSWGLIFLQPISCYYRWNWFCLFVVLVVACYVLQVLPKNLALCPLLIVNHVFILYVVCPCQEIFVRTLHKVAISEWSNNGTTPYY